MGPDTFNSWQIWAVLSAVFAALTAIFAKVGVEGINSDLATLIRTVIVLITLTLILFATGQFSNPGPVSAKNSPTKPARCITARSSIARSMARPRPRKRNR